MIEHENPAVREAPFREHDLLLIAARQVAAGRIGTRRLEMQTLESVQPEPEDTGGTPASTPAPGKKWRCRSGVGTLLSEYQNAPPSAISDRADDRPERAARSNG